MKKNTGYLFWIKGLSGSGKTTLSKEILEYVNKEYGNTIVLSGDNLRDACNFKKFDRASRLKYAMSYAKFCKEITDNKINLIFATVSLFKKVRNWNRKNIKNYVEIYIESDIKKLIKQGKKFFYKGNYKNIIGKNIKAEYPKSPHITIKNNFNKSVNVLAKELINKINKIIKL
jgi:adenylylsulfate kinase